MIGSRLLGTWAQKAVPPSRVMVSKATSRSRFRAPASRSSGSSSTALTYGSATRSDRSGSATAELPVRRSPPGTALRAGHAPASTAPGFSTIARPPRERSASAGRGLRRVGGSPPARTAACFPCSVAPLIGSDAPICRPPPDEVRGGAIGPGAIAAVGGLGAVTDSSGGAVGAVGGAGVGGLAAAGGAGSGCGSCAGGASGAGGGLVALRGGSSSSGST
jgi:hypothetical protein